MKQSVMSVTEFPPDAGRMAVQLSVTPKAKARQRDAVSGRFVELHFSVIFVSVAEAGLRVATVLA